MKIKLANKLEIILLILISILVLFVAFSVRSRNKEMTSQCRLMSTQLDTIINKLEKE